MHKITFFETDKIWSQMEYRANDIPLSSAHFHFILAL